MEDTPDHILKDPLGREDIQSVIVVLHIPLQPDIIRRCFAAGILVLSEKNIAKDVARARKLFNDYKETHATKGLIFSIAELFRFIPEFEFDRKWIVEDKLVSDITQLHLRIWRDQAPGGKYYETAWRKVPDYQGGFLLDGGVHYTDMLRYISGEEIIETVAMHGRWHRNSPRWARSTLISS